MLVLGRKVGESIILNEDIEIKIVEIKGDQVKIGISAPKNVKIYRKELYLQIQKENLEAVKGSADISALNKFISKNKKDN